MERYILAHVLGTSGNMATRYSLEEELAAAWSAAPPTRYPFDRPMVEEIVPDPAVAAVCREMFGAFQEVCRQLIPVYDRLAGIAH